MENEYDSLQHEKQNVSSTLSMFPPNSACPTPPPPYSNPSQYPPTSGMPYFQYNPPPYSAMGYSHPNATPPGQLCYPQPGVVYPGPPGSSYYSTQSQQPQQQPQVVLRNQPVGVTPVWVARSQPVSMFGAIVLSCFVFWCCGLVFGGIAFILAMVGHSSAAAGDDDGAIRMRNASYWISFAGIVCGIIIACVFFGVIFSSVPRGHY